MTEKNYNPEQKGMKAMQKQEMAVKHMQPEVKHETKAEKEEKKEIAEEKAEEKKEEAAEKKEEEKKKIDKKAKPKRTEAVVNGKSVPISTLDSMYIGKFIRNKTIPKAIADLEEVLAFKRAIPMKGEIPHRKGKIMAGRYPLNAIKEFIKLLKSLQANANVNGMDNPIIVESIANMAYRPFGRFGRVRRKRTHISIKVKEKKLISKKKK
ncbi:MAG TPA: uL22 family ribosomal protein [Patescibacteria group bacterium]|nr:uL22 family ribosomal protein [Patescibacteria group bacterium]